VEPAHNPSPLVADVDVPLRHQSQDLGVIGGHHRAQLVAAGETVRDVPSTLAARIRVLGSRRSDKNDPNDALSVAIAAIDDDTDMVHPLDRHVADPRCTRPSGW
jgi:hypothetical protein